MYIETNTKKSKHTPFWYYFIRTIETTSRTIAYIVIGFIVLIIILFIGKFIFFYDVNTDPRGLGDVAIVEWSNGEITDSEHSSMVYYKFQNDRVPIRVSYLNYLDDKNHKEITTDAYAHEQLNYNERGFYSKDGDEFYINVTIELKNENISKPMYWYKKYGYNWPVEVLKHSNYWSTLHNYASSHTSLSLNSKANRWDNYGEDYDTPEQITVWFHPVSKELDDKLYDQATAYLVPGYIRSDNGKTYTDSLDSTDVMTKTSSEFRKDVLIQSHIKNTKFY